MGETYTKKEKNRYLIGLSGQNIIYGIITSSLAYFLQFTILIPAVWVGVILSVARIFDAIKDPVIGATIGRGKRSLKYYLSVLPVPTAILTVLCFSNGVYSSSNSVLSNTLIVVLAFTFYILWEIVFTLGDIPITGYPSVLTSNEKDRNRLLSLRPIGSMACSISALLVQPVAFALAERLGNKSTDERNAFLITVVLFSILGGSMFQFTAVGSTERVKPTVNEKANQFKYFFTNPLLRKIALSGVLGSLKSMTGVILTPLVNYYFACKEPSLSLFYTFLWGTGSFIGLMISMWAVPVLSERYSCRKVYVWANLINILPNILLFLLYLKYPKNMTGVFQVVAMFLLTLIIGSCVSISSTVQPLIISEAVELESKISGNRPTAVFFSCQTFIVKIGTGISSLVASLSYVLIDFTSEKTAVLNEYISNGGVPRLDDEYSLFMATLFFLYTIPVAISSFLAALPFIKNSKEKSPLTRQKIF